MLILQLAEHGTLHKAAQQLGISQPAASAMLNDLESLIGLRLFERSSRGVVLNEQAQPILDCARTMLNEFANFAVVAGRIADGQQRVLRVGVVPQAYVTYLPKAIEGFRVAGGCIVEAIEGTSQQLLAQLLEGKLDCVIGRLPSGGHPEQGALSALAYADLYDEEICIAVSADHDESGLASLTYPELARREWVLQRRDSSVRRALNEAFLRHGVAVPEPVLETSNYMQSLAVIQATQYFTVAPKQAVETQQQLGLVRTVNFALGIAPMQVSFINRMTCENDPMIALFKKAVAHVVSSDGPVEHRSRLANASASAGTAAAIRRPRRHRPA